MKTKYWILLGVGTAIGAAVAGWLLAQKDRDEEKPPKGAPQLNLQHPGDQSEFTPSPGESEIG
ncbi:hypothetical protein [Flaviaesturariibacter amylovorans]|uniref:Uncharacterized protein n=1 Tax=Flaviaesturariibacter amylovorans TaxID=1084520 RepID=A0ABP8HVM3_9BACT